MKLSERMKMGREAAPWCIERVVKLEHAFETAQTFINSHIGDPDLTEEMIENYRAYLAAVAALEEDNND